MSNFDLSFVEEFIDASQRCTEPLELRDAFTNHVSTFGYENLGATNIDEKLSVIREREGDSRTSNRLGTYPDIWYQRFFEKSYFKIDPVSRKVKETNTPFYWDECYREHERAGKLTDLGKQFLSEATEYGLIHGVTIPIINTKARSSINLCGKYAVGGPGVMHMLHLTAIYFHQRLLTLYSSSRVLSPNDKVKLTPREAEVLKWYANGKSAWDISVVLDVSEAAVRFHLSNVRGKYGVASSVHATALAISRSDIRI